MSAESDELAEALSRHGDATSEYVRVEQQIRDGLSTRRRRRWSPLLAVLVALVLAAPLVVFTGRTHVMPSAFPDASNTGVPAGTSLTTYTGSCTIATPNTVINAKLVDCSDDPLTPGTLWIKAANVQITNSRVLSQIMMDTDRDWAQTSSFSLTDSEVDAGFIQLPAVGLGNMTILRSNIHGGQTAVQCESGATGGVGDTTVSCDIRDSYLHGQSIPVDAQWHLGGFLTEGGTNTITLDHNYVVCDAAQYPPDGGCTGDINILPHFGVPGNITVNNNKLGASPDLAYCAFAGAGIADFGPQAHDIVWTNNVFVRGSTNICGGFGPVTDCQVQSGSNFIGNVWSNNKYEDGSTVVCF